MIEFRPCTVEDIDAIQPYPTEMLLLDTLKRDLTYSVACIVDDEPIAAGGVQVLYPGVGEAWTLLSEQVIRDHPTALSRYTRRWLDRFQETEGIVRVQSLCENTAVHLQWLLTLGFSPEGLMLSAGIHGKGDYWMCGRVR